LDNQITPKEILESYDQITIEKQIFDGAFLIKLFKKTFVLFCPDANKPDSRPSIYLYNDNGFDFPHVMLHEEEVIDNKDFPKGKYRWVCLYEQESVVNSIVSYEDKIFDVIDRLIELLSMTSVEREKEFQKEFLFYWNAASSSRPVKIYLSQEESFCRMSVYCSKTDTRYIETGLELSDLNERKKNERMWQHHVENDVFFIPIEDTREILPPHRGHPWTINNVKDILYGKQIDHISAETYQSINNEMISTQNTVLVFGMKGEQSNATFAVKVKCKNITGRTLIQKICEDALDVEPLVTVRRDYSFLSYQIGNDIGLHGKKVLLIGGGSLGSYVAFELVKNGVSSLKIYDRDMLADENILRWAYGGYGIGKNKAKILGLQLGLLHPEIHIEATDKNIDSKTLIEDEKLADMIVFTIGSSDFQLSFNRTLHENQCHIPVIYTWLEAGGRYSHVLKVDYSKLGCYECLFTNDQGELVNNRASLNEEQDIGEQIIRNGCGGTRAAYGTAVLLRTTAALLDVIQKILSGEMEENTLINISPERVSPSSCVIPMEACNCCGNRNKL